jgi:hypothetical protein
MPDVKQTWFDRPKVEYETPDEIFNPLNSEETRKKMSETHRRRWYDKKNSDKQLSIS